MSSQNTTSFQIEGMTCASCVGRVEKALASAPGVTSASVNLATESAQVSFDDSTDAPTLSKVLTEAGYPAISKELTLEIEGMTCASCVGRVEKALASAPGVESVILPPKAPPSAISAVQFQPLIWQPSLQRPVTVPRSRAMPVIQAKRDQSAKPPRRVILAC